MLYLCRDYSCAISVIRRASLVHKGFNLLISSSRFGSAHACGDMKRHQKKLYIIECSGQNSPLYRALASRLVELSHSEHVKYSTTRISEEKIYDT